MPDPALHLARLVRRGIAEIADPARAPRMQAYMRAAMPYRGVTSAPLRRLLRELYTTHPLPGRDAWRSCVLELWDHAGYREERYAAIALTSHRLYQAHQDPATLPLYRHLVVTGAWWDYVDPLATHDVGRILVAHADEVAPLIRAWSLDDDMWLRRSRSCASCTGGPARTSPCSARWWRRTSRAAASGRSSSSARPSGGRCASTRASTPTGCEPSSPGTETGCPA
jgi:hypothetical protein